ncbi:MAG: Ferredoxin--NADP reductase [Alphaproteobacteria bacterium MarineAlpha5_Bin12]|nr:MAG: Ferredoxin--NADP reductase [Alphaproteobacteria bacterium MarineAlpha5_Bin12]|tara:strand:+ start:533 stop:1867 length:1335 start_codon:yes stop_codon:yes gene_type:complete
MTKTAIIGAGPCGLSQLRAFQQSELKGEKIPKIVCFEQQDKLGGLWNYSWRTGSNQYGEPVPNSMYRYLWSNGPKECLEFADYPFDKHFGRAIPSFPPREVLYDYILGRAKDGDLKKYVRLSTTVNSVIFDENKFIIKSTNKKENKISTEEFDNVVVATGHFSVPYIPEYEGMDSFSGRIMHSHDFRDAEEFRGKNIVVLGSSYSAEDVALQCYKYGAKSVTIGYRNNPMGFKWPEGMKEVHHLDKLDGKKAIFKDGHLQETDVLILCSGYLHHFPFLEESLKLKTHNRLYPPNLYKGVVWQDNHKLMYLGMQDQFHTFNMFDCQAWYARDVIMGKIKMPDSKEIEKNIKEWISKEEKLEDPIQMIDFQTEYTKELYAASNYPEIDFEIIRKHFHSWEHHKEEDIMTYRNRSFTSPVTGTVAPIHHTPWGEAMDDSMATFLNQK